jgi:hypothetical protein
LASLLFLVNGSLIPLGNPEKTFTIFLLDSMYEG